jgi:hypothetical protein
MVTATALKPSLQTEPEEQQGVEKKIQQFRELFADAPELGKKAIENALQDPNRRLRICRRRLRALAVSVPVWERCRS